MDSILNEMGGFEHKWNRIVEEASILQGNVLSNILLLREDDFRHQRTGIFEIR